jgi:AcrR family transcriptional regulator
MSPRPRREERHPDLQTAIKETAWKQIVKFGAPTISLRAIARELKITAPSIYHYYPSRDDLVTALIVDAFTSFADSQQDVISTIPEQEHAERMRALGLAYRSWAIAFPERYQLIFGTPIAGYIAPEEITMPVAARSLTILVSVLQSAYTAGKLRRVASHDMSPQIKTMFAPWQQAYGAADTQVMFIAISIWGQVHGLVSIEIGHQFPPFITDPGEVYRRVIDILIAQHIPDVL